MLRGSFGQDRLTGGPGSDTLDGGVGFDVFAFTSPSDSAPTAPDVILAFDGRGAAAGDKIDLSAIDANGQLAGNQAFGFGGTTIGRVRLVEQRPDTEVLANTDADAAAEVRIVVRDGAAQAASYTAADFTL